MTMKKAILIILIFFTWILVSNAAQQRDLIQYFKNNDTISVNDTDLSYCSWKQEDGIFALPDWVKYPYTNADIDKLQKELDTTKVDTKSKTSVDSYNNNLDKIHSMMTANNNIMQKMWIPVLEYCKPYNCNKDFPWTVYEKSTDRCVCADWKEFNKIKNICPIKEVSLPVRQNIEFKNDLDMQKGELLLRIIWILLGLAVLYLVFRD